MTEEEMLEKYPVLKDRSRKSREKIADTMLEISNKLFTIFFVSIISLPMMGAFKVIFSSSDISADLKVIFDNLNSPIYLVIVSLLVIAVLLGNNLKRSALDVYDFLESRQSK